MMNDVDDNIIDTIIVKDLSRFGRNHLEVGTYLDEIFLINDVRFISIDDNYDNKGVMDEFSTFKNIFNEMYIKDLKKKIKSTFDYKAKNKLLNPRPGGFYGLTTNENKGYIIDEEATKIVKKIYQLYLDGYSTSKIASILTKNKIINPGYYRYIKYNDKACYKDNSDIYHWNECTINKILSNEEYTGIIINRKYIHKNGKRILNPNPTIIQNALPVIITKDIFDKVSSIKKTRMIVHEKKYINPLPNIIKCGCCNRVMRYTFSYTMNMYFYLCRRCKTRIYIDDIRKILKEDIQLQVNNISDENIINYNESNVRKTNRQIKLIDSKIQSLFEAFANGNLEENNFKNKIKELNILKSELNLKLASLNKKKKLSLESIGDKIDDNSILKVIDGAYIINTGKRKYKVHIIYK